LDKKNKITATVCLYSGRPNPYWVMAVKEYNKLLLAVKNLPVTLPRQPPSLLGYTGLMLAAEKNTLYVFNEMITVTEGKSVTGFRDADRKMEKEILRSAPVIVLEEIKGILPGHLL
jgi:hypothetical protein